MSNDTNKISLLIGGNPRRKGGFSPLAIIGTTPVDPNTLVNNMYRASTIAQKEKLYYIIQHASQYIQYQFIDINIQLSDSDTLGTLNISLFIDRGVQLAGGQSPYTLLKRVHDTFCSRCMTPTADGGYRFTGNDIDPKIFNAIVREFAVEPRTTSYVLMNGSLSAIMCIAPDKLEDFFRDTQYPEFKDYKDIEIGSACQELTGAFAHLASLPIPRPIPYHVIINVAGTPTTKTLTLPTDRLTTKREDTPTKIYPSVSCTLEEILNKKAIDHADIVILDRHQIKCTVIPTERKYNIKIDWTAVDSAYKQDYAYGNGVLKFEIGGAGGYILHAQNDDDAVKASYIFKDENGTSFNPVIVRDKDKEHEKIKAILQYDENREVSLVIQKKTPPAVAPTPVTKSGREYDRTGGTTSREPVRTGGKFTGDRYTPESGKPHAGIPLNPYPDDNNQPEKKRSWLLPLLLGLAIGLLIGTGVAFGIYKHYDSELTDVEIKLQLYEEKAQKEAEAKAQKEAEE
ncbi:MAG: hypothetical protein J1E02_03875, partial [Coprobacter sp.]|nr:hypothetical protein [Coprobacter sp.]